METGTRFKVSSERLRMILTKMGRAPEIGLFGYIFVSQISEKETGNIITKLIDTEQQVRASQDSFFPTKHRIV